MSAIATSAPRRELEVIALVGFGHGVSHFFHFMIPPLFPWLMRDFGLSFTQVGVTTAVFFVVSGVGQAAAGFVVDHWGARRILLAGIALFAVAALMLGMAPSYPALLLAAAVAGIGNCVFHPADFTLLNRNVSSARLGHAFSVHGLAGNLGWALGPAFMTALTMAFDWRTAAFAAAALALLAWGAIFVRRETMTETRMAVPATAAVPSSTFTFLRSGAVWMCFLFFFLVTMTFGALQNFAPPVLHHIYGLSLATGASALTTFLLGGAAGIVVGGFMVSHSEAHDRRIAWMLVTAAVFMTLLASGAIPAWGVLPLMAAAGFCSGIVGPSRDMLVRRAATARFGQRAFGRVYGFVYSGLDLGLSLAPLIFGPMMDAGRFAGVLIGVALMQGLAMFTALRVGRGAATESA
ncbi:MAG: MFS transporter [Gammaproteobacteria bacterium]|nr:MFS transporter [Gammaproteobacteria bacterium]